MKAQSYLRIYPETSLILICEVAFFTLSVITMRVNSRASLGSEVHHLKAQVPVMGTSIDQESSHFQSSNFNQINPLEVARCFTQLATQDLFSKAHPLQSNQQHFQAAVQWLKRAQDATPDDGVSWGYSLKGGWRSSYRETSGYIAITLFDVAARLGDRDAYERAVRIARWLCDRQNDDGSIANPAFGTSGIVFDTGQVLGGLVRAYQETQDPAILQAALKAGDWLAAVADSEGRWTRHTHGGIPHVYNARVAWFLAQLNAIAPSPERDRVARANLDWAVACQRPNGWFEQCAFTAGAAPFTHTIAYVIRGLLEAGLLLQESRYLESATRGAEALLPHLRSDGFMPAQIDVDGSPVNTYCCLTGNCQIAIIWLKLFQQTGQAHYRAAAEQALRYVMAHQDLTTPNANIHGAIKGSQPIWGKYAPFGYPNWATKFFIDGLLLWAACDPEAFRVADEVLV